MSTLFSDKLAAGRRTQMGKGGSIYIFDFLLRKFTADTPRAASSSVNRNFTRRTYFPSIETKFYDRFSHY